MPLIDLAVPTHTDRPPPAVRRLIREADRRIAEFQSDARCPAFVPSSYAEVYGVLHALSDGNATRGRQFCEWGSGFGVVADLAAMLDFESCGIEVEAQLVGEANRLAEDVGLSVEFVHGSFIPPGAERRVLAAGNYSWLTTESTNAYEELGLEPEDMDVVFAYPWPDEVEVVAELFERYCGVGAILATHHGGDEFRLRRKVGRRARRPTLRRRRNSSPPWWVARIAPTPQYRSNNSATTSTSSGHG
ncbi:MAG TPA: hypothetical protein VM529_27395 [Gemmata sp.]|nr:hypothetical protein [Gemmata sp.]